MYTSNQDLDNHWLHPLEDFAKCNLDVGFNKDTRPGIGGWIICNHERQPPYWDLGKTSFSSTPLEVEAKGSLIKITHM